MMTPGIHHITIDPARPALPAPSARSAVLLAAAVLLIAAVPVATASARPAFTPVADVESGEPMAIPTPVPDVPPVRSSSFGGGLGSSPAPTAPYYAPGPNAGPVTGYGPGGMGIAPGSPANPPYGGGGLGGRR